MLGNKRGDVASNDVEVDVGLAQFFSEQNHFLTTQTSEVLVLLHLASYLPFSLQ